jgi:uncharacterized protein (DUF433 family)
MDWKLRISADPKVMFGKPVIKGTRIPVDLIVDKMAGGRTIEQLLKSYPRLVEADIYACLQLAGAWKGWDDADFESYLFENQKLRTDFLVNRELDL